MAYVDGFIVTIPKKYLAEYRRISAAAGKVWREHGALQYVEAAADDTKAEGMIPFPKAVAAKRGELVIFAWIVFKSRAQRDRVNKKVMADKRLEAMMQPGAMPFDVSRMVYGGFEVIVDA